MGFTTCYIGLTSEHLSNAISKAMVNLALSMDNRRRYRYDGAGAIAGTEVCSITYVMKKSKCNLHSFLFTHTKLLCHEMHQNSVS